MKKHLVFLRFMTILLFMILVQQPLHAQKTGAPQLGKASIKDVVAAMTLDEKVKLLVGNGFHMPGVSTPSGPTIGQTQDKVPGAAGTTFAIPRLGIPSMVVSDGPAGVRIDPIRNKDSSKTYYATAWPVATLLASTWDTALVKKVGVAFGHEIHEYGIDIILGPALNIHRNPLGGRNFEYYSEDPVVAGYMTAAMVKGIQSNGVGTSIKHFAANNQETDRNTVNTIVSERALREIYLKGFEIAVKQSQPWTVMSSYNYINGTYTSESYDLLTTILRKEWGFKGFVMTDWFGGKDAAGQIKAGNNLLMPGTGDQAKKIMEAVKSGELSEKVIDENVAGILNIILHSPVFKGYKYSDKPNLKQDAAISRQAASEGMVLLKNNDHALPLVKSANKIALFGIGGYDLVAGGTGSGDVNKAYSVSLVEGLSGAGFAVDADVKKLFAGYLAEYKISHPKKGLIEEFMHPTPPAEEMKVDAALIAQKAVQSDIAIVCIARNAGEGRDRKMESDYNLNDNEKALIKSVADAFHAQHKRLVVVLNIGGVINVADWSDDADAILLAWQPGLEGGNAMADVLSGKVNPSGKLATTFPVNYNDQASAKNFPGKEFPEKATTGMLGMKAIPAEVTYEEGIYVGYRYFNTFNVRPAYEFGFGMSYTSFKYSRLKLSSASFSGKITASITVTNTGKVAGKEVVQLYLAAPAGKIDKPAEELKAFAKTALLQPGKSQVLTFTLRAEDLASFNTESTAWVADAGTYTVKIGASSTDIRQTATFTLGKELVTEKDNKVMVPQVTINELKK